MFSLHFVRVMWSMITTKGKQVNITSGFYPDEAMREHFNPKSPQFRYELVYSEELQGVLFQLKILRKLCII